MYIYKASLLEELVNRIGDQGTNPEYGLEGVGSGAQMGNRSQILEGVTLLLQRVIRCGIALYSDLCCLNLEGLLCLRGGHQGSLYDNSCAYVQLGDLLEVLHVVMIYDLQCLEIASVSHNQETEGLGTTVAAEPACYGDFLIQIAFSITI